MREIKFLPEQRGSRRILSYRPYFTPEGWLKEKKSMLWRRADEVDLSYPRSPQGTALSPETTGVSAVGDEQQVLILSKVDSGMKGNYSCVAENLVGTSEESNRIELVVKCITDRPTELD